MTPDQMLLYVCDKMLIHPQAVLSHSRHKKLVIARRLLAYAIRKKYNWSLNDIKEFLHREDHTTIINLLNKTPQLVDVYPQYGEYLQELLT